MTTSLREIAGFSGLGSALGYTMNIVESAWIAVGAVFALTFAVGVGVQHQVDTRRPDGGRLVQFLYLWIPLGSAFVVALLLGVAS